MQFLTQQKLDLQRHSSVSERLVKELHLRKYRQTQFCLPSELSGWCIEQGRSYLEHIDLEEGFGCIWPLIFRFKEQTEGWILPQLLKGPLH